MQVSWGHDKDGRVIEVENSNFSRPGEVWKIQP